MYTLYKVKSIKSQIKGYWLDKGKVYKDNIIQVKFKSKKLLFDVIGYEFTKGQKAVFYSFNKKGYCMQKNGELTVYNKRLRLRRKRLSIRFFKLLLAYYGGITCYKLQDKYIIEIFYN